MRYLILLYALFFHNYCFAQSSEWEISGGLGISGVNQLLKNNVEFDNHLKFNKKNNVLDNKYKNNVLHSGYLYISKSPSSGILKGYNINMSTAIYSFNSVYYKEDKLSVTFNTNDTINTPNWLIAKYSLPFIEIGVSKKINIQKHLTIEFGLFCSYMVELYGTSNVILFDSAYYQWERQNFTFYKDYPNIEFDQINYGLRGLIQLFPLKKIHPTIMFTQSLNDLSLKSFNINQHANLWALHVGLSYNFYHTGNEIKKQNY